MNNSKKKIAIINGSNINLLGIREPQNYGTVKWEDIEKKLIKKASLSDIDLIFYQSNHEGKIVDYLQENLFQIDGVVINPAGFSYTGYSILDTLKSIDIPYIEVHLSNVFVGGENCNNYKTLFMEHSKGFICGLKSLVYELGLEAIINYLNGEEHNGTK